MQSLLKYWKKIINNRNAWLITMFVLLGFNGIVKLFEKYFGDSDGLITGHLQFVVFDITIIITLFFVFLCYQKSKRIQDIQINSILWPILIGIAGIIRVYFATLGHNYDLDSYDLVADIILRSESVYGNTERYNYGPIWAYSLAAIKYCVNIIGFTKTKFHIAIVLVLFIAELLFYKQLFNRYKNNLMVLILLFNPISMIIIGHHSQFDILAIALAFYAYSKLNDGQIIQAVIFLGISFCIKHVMVFLPLLTLFDQKQSIKNRIAFLIIPACIFILSFLPFLNDIEGIKQNVLSYQHNNNQTFLKHFFDLMIPGFIIKMGLFKILPVFEGYKFLWLMIFPLIGYLIHKKETEDRFLIYLMVMVGTSLAISEQYFLIPLAGVIYYRKYFFSWLYLAAASYYIMFVSFNNTSQYFNLKSLGIGFEFERYQLGLAQVQICLILLLCQIFFNSFKQNKSTGIL